MISFLLIFINPFKQVQKARDTQRQQDLKQINNALDVYYNDNNNYPTSFSFGSSWQVGSIVYMKQVPQDPDCTSGGSCYAYLTDSSNPQWNVLFAKLASPSNSSVSCALANLSSCLPTNYGSLGYNYCAVSGKVDCSFISSHAL